MVKTGKNQLIEFFAFEYIASYTADQLYILWIYLFFFSFFVESRLSLL
jgi:hypothetical protein